MLTVLMVSTALAAELPAQAVLGVSDDVWAQAKRFAERPLDDNANLCTALLEAEPLAKALAAPIFKRRDALFDDDTRYAELNKAVAQLDTALVGIHLAIGAATVYAHADYAEFAAGTDPASATTLKAAHGVLGNSWPGWLTQTTDLGGCVNTTRDPFAALAEAWPKTPACVRERLAPKLRASLDRLGDRACYCDDQATVERGLSAWSPSLNRLDSVGGPATVAALQESLKKAEFSSSCAI